MPTYMDEVYAENSGAGPSFLAHLDETSNAAGTTVLDAIAGRNGSLVIPAGGSITHQAGSLLPVQPNDSAMRFATGGHAQFAAAGSAVGNVGRSGTATLWYRHGTALAANQSAVIIDRRGASYNALRIGIVADASGNNRLFATVYLSGGITTITSNQTLALNQEVHIALRMYPTGGSSSMTDIQLYQNGTVVAGASGLTGTMDGTAGPLTIGRAYDGAAGLNLPGARVDEVAFFTTALSATRILAHYNAGVQAADTVAPTTAVTTSKTANSITLNAISSEKGSRYQFRYTFNGVTSAETEYGYTTSTRSHTWSGLGEGSYYVEARSQDINKNWGEWTGSTVVLDATAPQTFIDSVTVDSRTSRTFTFSSSEPGGTFLVSLDNAAWIAGSSPYTWSGLSDGAHSFRVRATDPSGNTDASPAEHAFTVEPAPSISGVAYVPSPVQPGQSTEANITHNGGAVYQLSADLDNSGSYETARTGGQSTLNATTLALVFTAPNTPGTYTHRWRITYNDGQEADYTSQMVVVDNTPPPDTTAPVVNITGTGSTHDTASFSWSSDDPAATYEVSLGGTSWTSVGTAVAHTFAGLTPETVYTVWVRASDAAGNQSSDSETVTTSAPPGSAPTLVLSTSEPVGPATWGIGLTANTPDATIEARLGAGPWETVSTGVGGGETSGTYVVGPLESGTYTVEARAFNEYGYSNTISESFTVDATPPSIAWVSTPASPGAPGSKAYSWSSDDPQAYYQLDLAPGVYADLPAGSTSHTFADVEAGTYTVTLIAVDSSSNVTVITHELVVQAPQPPTDPGGILRRPPRRVPLRAPKRSSVYRRVFGRGGAF